MSKSQPTELRRALGLGATTIYGIGDILGAGIYALVGKVAGVAGHQTWLSFAGALLVAGLTALSYAELAGRYPRSGSEAYYVRQAFPSKGLGVFVGWLVFCSGVVSTATVSHAFAGYFGTLVPGVPAVALLAGFLGLIAVVNFMGIRQSSLVNMICTAIEVSGLLIVIYAGWSYLTCATSGSPSTVEPASWTTIAQGSVLAFYAFIGFEDMVNVAEEVKEPERTLPKAVIGALVTAGCIYLIVSSVATAVVPPAALSASDAPLVEVVRKGSPGIPPAMFTLIALVAVSNTGLLNFITGSRLLYGMSRQGLLPEWLGVVHPERRTPHHAIIAILGATLALALSGGLVFLAGTTSLLLLVVFFAVNSSLLVIKVRQQPDEAGFGVPTAIPAAGAASALGLALFVPKTALPAAGLLALVGLLLFAMTQRFSKKSS